MSEMMAIIQGHYAFQPRLKISSRDTESEISFFHYQQPKYIVCEKDRVGLGPPKMR